MQDPTRPREDETPEALLQAFAGRDANAQLKVVSRTRRAIRVANETRREQGERGRHDIGITLFVLGAIFVVLAPAMWGSLDDFFGGEHFGDLPAQVTLISTLLMLAVVGALIAVWRNRTNQDEYRQDH
jgi:protein-S-isoprenylcysteine O-methyltransferase Ste14